MLNKNVVNQSPASSMVSRTIVVDPGKNEVKVIVVNGNYDLEKMFSFPSKSKRKRNFSDIDSGSEHQYKVSFNGEKFLVGEGISDSYNFDTTKNNTHHLLCIYTAVASVVTAPNEKIKLVVGYPSSDFSNSTQREEYYNLINSDEAINIEINGESKSFEIVDLTILPEGIGLLPRVGVGQKRIQVIDIGGQNINYRSYDVKGNTLASYSLDSAGVNLLEEYLRKELRRVVNADLICIDDLDIIGLVKEVPSDLTSYIDGQFIKDTVFDFIEEHMFAKLSSKGATLYQRGSYLVFTGGGSLLLQTYIEELLSNNKGNMSFSKTSKWDNSISYLIKDMGQKFNSLGRAKEGSACADKVISQIENLIETSSI